MILEHSEDCDVRRARRDYAARHAPGLPGMMGIFGRVFFIAERLPGALRSAFLGFMMVLVSDAWLWRDLARLAYMLHHYEEAVDAYEQLDQLDPAYFDEPTEDLEMWEEARVAASGAVGLAR